MSDGVSCELCGQRSNYDTSGWKTADEVSLCPRCHVICDNENVDVEEAWQDYGFVLNFYIHMLKESDYVNLSDAYTAVLEWAVEKYHSGNWDIGTANRYKIAKEVVNIGYAIQAIDPHTSYSQNDAKIRYKAEDGRMHTIAEPKSDVYPNALKIFSDELSGKWQVESIGARGEKQLFTPDAVEKLERYRKLKSKIERFESEKQELWQDLQDTNERAVAQIYDQIN